MFGENARISEKGVAVRAYKTGTSCPFPVIPAKQPRHVGKIRLKVHRVRSKHHVKDLNSLKSPSRPTDVSPDDAEPPSS